MNGKAQTHLAFTTAAKSHRVNGHGLDRALSSQIRKYVWQGGLGLGLVLQCSGLAGLASRRRRRQETAGFAGETYGLLSAGLPVGEGHRRGFLAHLLLRICGHVGKWRAKGRAVGRAEESVG